MVTSSKSTPDAAATKPLTAPRKVSFEQALEKLERIVDKLESGDASLDESLALYEEGVATLKVCHGVLEQAEKKIEQLVKDAGGQTGTRPFAVEVESRGGTSD